MKKLLLAGIALAFAASAFRWWLMWHDLAAGWLVATQAFHGPDVFAGGTPIPSSHHLTSPKVSRGEARIVQLDGRPFVDQ